MSADQTAEMLMDVTVPYVYRYRAALISVAGTDDFVDGHSELCWCRRASMWGDHETICLNVRDLLGQATWWIPAPNVGESLGDAPSTSSERSEDATPNEAADQPRLQRE